VQNQDHPQGGLLRPGSGLFLGPPPYRPRTPWRPSLALVAAFVIVALSIGGALLVLKVLGGIPVSVSGRGDTGAFAAGLQVFALWQGMMVVWTLLASMLFGGRVRDVLALHATTGGWRIYGAAILTLAVMQTLLSIVQYYTVSGDLYADLRPFVRLIQGPDWLLAASVIGIGAPLSEELLFRGFVLSALAATRLGFWGAAIISTGLWTALHAGYSLVGILEVFIIGMFFSWLLWRTGSLRVTIFCHALYNSLIVLALRFVELPAQG
jgi:membrane protease YdiL (CAAX protease family)